MKKIVFSFLMVSMMFVSSCGGSTTTETDSEAIQNAETQNAETAKKDKVIKVTPETTTVKGSLNGCFEVVDRTYKLTIDKYGKPEMRIELKRTSAPLPFNVADVVDMYGARSSSKPQVFGIGVEFLDADGDVVATISPYSKSDALLLFGLNTDETATFEIFMSYSDAENVSKAVKFRVTSIVKENTYKDEQKEETSTETTTETTSDYSFDYDIDDDDLDKAVKATKKAAEVAGDLYDVAKALDVL